MNEKPYDIQQFIKEIENLKNNSYRSDSKFGIFIDGKMACVSRIRIYKSASRAKTELIRFFTSSWAPGKKWNDIKSYVDQLIQDGIIEIKQI